MAALVILGSLEQTQARVVNIHVPKDPSELLTVEGIMSTIDYISLRLLGVPLRSPGQEYKTKSEDLASLK